MAPRPFNKASRRDPIKKLDKINVVPFERNLLKRNNTNQDAWPYPVKSQLVSMSHLGVEV
jgi:hypothetical protein